MEKMITKMVDNGLKIVYTYNGSKILGLNEEEFSGEKTICTTDNPKAEIKVDGSFRIERFIDISKLKHLSTTAKAVVVIDNNTCFTDNGEIHKLQEIFTSVKPDLKPKKLVVGDLVSVDKLVMNNVIFGLSSAYFTKDMGRMNGKLVGIVTRVNSDNTITIKLDGSSIDVHSATVSKIGSKDIGKCLVPFIKHAVESNCKISFNEEFQYMKLSDCGGFITYITKDRVSRFDGNVWNDELRSKLGTKKKIRAMLMGVFGMNQHQAELAITLYGKFGDVVEVLEGEDIRQVFVSSNIVDSGNLGQSCMMGKNSNYFDVYVDNAKCGVIRNTEGKIVARALLWVAKKDGAKKIKIMDRIYTCDDKLVPVMKRWARDNGYHHLTDQSHSMYETTAPNGDTKKISGYYITAKRQYERYPYMDTFYVCVGDRFYARHSLKSAHSTGGRLEAM